MGDKLPIDQERDFTEKPAAASKRYGIFTGRISPLLRYLAITDSPSRAVKTADYLQFGSTVHLSDTRLQAAPTVEWV